MAEQPGRTGKCTNFGNCTLADTGAEIPIPAGGAAVCTECGRALMVSQPPRGRSKLIGTIIALVVLVVALGLGVKLLLDALSPAAGPHSTAVAAPPQPPEAPQTPPPTDQADPPAPAPTPAPATPAGSRPDGGDMVRVADFWIDRTEVSTGDYRAAVPGYRAPLGFTDDLPVVDVTFEDARRYAAGKGHRLCRESEWLYALGDETAFPARAALNAGTMDRPRPVTDDRDENSHGLLNMVGNVAEWVDPGTDEAAFVGGYWYWASEGRPAAELKRVTRLATRQGRQHYIGFRTCRDAGP